MRNNNIISKSLLSSAVVVASFNGQLAAADGFMLEEVMVTAQRRAESLQDAPLSVSALSSENLEALKLHGTTEIASQIPNVTISTPYAESQPSFSIRGVSMSDFSQNQSSPIAMYVDDVYKGVGALQALQLFDLERIEVLRGPQGTLYGKNATGGAVNILSREPQLTEDYNGHVSFGYGNFNRLESDGAVDLTISEDVLGVRAAYTYARADGWIDNGFPQGDDLGKLDDYAFRLTGKYEPTSDLSIVARYSKSRSRQSDGYEVLVTNIGPGGVGFNTGYTGQGLDFFEGELDRLDSELEVQNESVSFAIDWSFSDFLTLTSITSYDEGDWIALEDADGSPFNILHSDFKSDVRSISQDFRLSSTFDGPFNFLMGVYGHHEDLDASIVYRTYYEYAGDSDNNGLNDCLDDFATGCRLSNSLNQVKNSTAVYFQGEYDLSDDLTFTLGLRYTEDENKLKDYDAGIGFFDPVTGTEVIDAVPTVADYSDEVNDTNWGTRMALDYSINDSTLAYFSFTTGYRNSAFNGQAFYDPSEITIAEPEEVDAWELGFKSDFFENKMRLNGSVFYYKYENQQFLDTTPQILQILANAKESEIFGAELELSAIVSSNLEVNAGLGYLDTEYKDLTLRGQDLSGNELINAPKLNFNTMINWRIIEIDAGDIYLNVDTVFVDDQFFDAFNSDNASQDAYWVSNMRLGFTNSNENIDVGAWVKNIADKEYATSILDLQGSFNLDYGHRGKTRTFGVDINYQF